MIPDFYTFQNDYHDKSNCPLSPYKVITLLLTVFSTLYTSYCMTHVFCNQKFMSLHFPHLFLSCIPSPLAATYWFSISVIPFLFGYTCSFVSVFRVHLYVKSYRICLPLFDIFSKKLGMPTFIYLFIYLAALLGLQDLSSTTRD